MRCSHCGNADTKVTDSRPADGGASIRRRRVCLQCGNKFSTYEYEETMPIMVIKKDRTRQLFDRDKLISGILKACHKRPITASQIDGLVREIEAVIKASGKTEVQSVDLGTMVMERLRDIDEIAYVRFASVYREFKDVETFMAELAEIKDRHNK